MGKLQPATQVPHERFPDWTVRPNEFIGLMSQSRDSEGTPLPSILCKREFRFPTVVSVSAVPINRDFVYVQLVVYQLATWVHIIKISSAILISPICSDNGGYTAKTNLIQGGFP